MNPISKVGVKFSKENEDKIMALTKDQRFFWEILWFLLSNGEDFRVMYKGKEYMNIGKSVYEDGVLMKEYENDY